MPASALAIDSVYGCAMCSGETESCSDMGGRCAQLEAELTLSLSGICSKKIILQEKVDIFVPSIVKSTTEIIISDASTDLNRIYAEVSERIR